MFRTLIFPPSAACDCVDELPKLLKHPPSQNKTTDEAIHQHSCRFLKIDILIYETR